MARPYSPKRLDSFVKVAARAMFPASERGAFGWTEESYKEAALDVVNFARAFMEQADRSKNG